MPPTIGQVARATVRFPDRDPGTAVMAFEVVDALARLGRLTLLPGVIIDCPPPLPAPGFELEPETTFQLRGDPMNSLCIRRHLPWRGIGPASDVGHRLPGRVEPRRRQRDEDGGLGHDLSARPPKLLIPRAVYGVSYTHLRAHE